MTESMIVIGILVVAGILLVILFLVLSNKNGRYPHRDSHRHRRYVGGCDGTRYGCCPDRITAKKDQWGSNCVPRPRPPHPPHHNPNIGGCRGTRYGCCADGVTPADSDNDRCKLLYQNNHRENFEYNDNDNNNDNNNEDNNGEKFASYSETTSDENIENDVDAYNSIPKLYTLED